MFHIYFIFLTPNFSTYIQITTYFEFSSLLFFYNERRKISIIKFIPSFSFELIISGDGKIPYGPQKFLIEKKNEKGTKIFSISNFAQKSCLNFEKGIYYVIFMYTIFFSLTFYIFKQEKINFKFTFFKDFPCLFYKLR